MRTISIIANVLAVSALIFASTSCNEKEEPKVTKKMEVSAKESYSVAAKDAKAISFDISSNTPWTISNDASWIHISDESSETASLMATITVTFDDNEGTESRNGKLTINGEGVEPVKIEFTQTVPGAITVDQQLTEFPIGGGQQSFTILSNKAWEVSADKTWLSFSPASGQASQEPVTVTVTASENGGKGETAVITVASIEDETSFTFNASIDGVKLQFGEIAEADKNFTWTGGEQIYTFESNTAYRINLEPSYEGISAEKVEGGIKLSVSQNNIFIDRTFSLTVVPEDEQFAEVAMASLTISQGNMLEANPASQVIFNENGSATFRLETAGNMLIKTKDVFKYGSYTWTFSEFNITAGQFQVSNWWYEPQVYFLLNFGHDKKNCAAGGIITVNDKKVCFGFDNGWGGLWNDTKNFTAGSYPEDLSTVKDITLLLLPGERKGTEQNRIIIRKVYINGQLVLDWNTNSGDIWQEGSEVPGMPFNFGFEAMAGTATIDSFKIDTDYQKYL